MSVKTLYNNTTGRLEFYPDFVSYSSIPESAIDITNDQWQDAVANPGKYKITNNVFTAATIWPPVVSNIVLKQQKLDELNYEYLNKKVALDRRRIAIVLGNSDSTVISTKTIALVKEYGDLLNELKTKQGEIING